LAPLQHSGVGIIGYYQRNLCPAIAAKMGNNLFGVGAIARSQNHYFFTHESTNW